MKTYRKIKYKYLIKILLQEKMAQAISKLDSIGIMSPQKVCVITYKSFLPLTSKDFSYDN
jgi:hypothetical protein